MRALLAALRHIPAWAVWLAAGVLLLLVGAGGGALVRSIVTDEQDEAMSEAHVRVEDLAGARAAVQDRFPNVEAITFGQAFVHGDGETQAVCGQVDIQAPDDGFQGPERFVFADGELTLEETEGSDAMAQKWRDVCEG